MLGSINAMFLMCFRLSKLHEAGKMSHADASMVKAWTTLRGICYSNVWPHCCCFLQMQDTGSLKQQVVHTQALRSPFYATFY